MPFHNSNSAARSRIDPAEAEPVENAGLAGALAEYWNALADMDWAQHSAKNLQNVADNVVQSILDREDRALAAIAPHRSETKADLIEKIRVLLKMAETDRASEEIAAFASAIAMDAKRLPAA